MCFCVEEHTVYRPTDNMQEEDLDLKTCLLHWHNAIEYVWFSDYQLSELSANWQRFPTASEQRCIYYSYTFQSCLAPVRWERSEWSSCEWRIKVGGAPDGTVLENWMEEKWVWLLMGHSCKIKVYKTDPLQCADQAYVHVNGCSYVTRVAPRR